MAFTANTAFEIKVSNHEFDSTANISGYYYAQDPGTGDYVATDCSAGFLCVKHDLKANEGYSIVNGNTWEMFPAAGTETVATPIYACNPHNVQEIVAPDGNVYKIGANTLGLGIPAGERDTFTRIDFLPGDRHYRFGVGNLTTALSTNQYLTLGTSTNAGKLVPAASAPTANGAVYFKVLGTGTFTQGAYAGFGYVDVEAHAVIVAPAG